MKNVTEEERAKAVYEFGLSVPNSIKKLRRLEKRCLGCGNALDVHTPDCGNCHQRMRYRERAGYPNRDVSITKRRNQPCSKCGASGGNLNTDCVTCKHKIRQRQLRGTHE